jgi:2-dehydropantoate 2-reductase
VAEPRHAVVGAGPVGTMLVAALQGNGVPLIWFVRNPERRAQLEVLPVCAGADARIVADASALRHADLEWVILAVKAQQVEPLLTGFTIAQRERTLVVANGLHSGAFNLGSLYGGGRLDEQGRLHCCDENVLRMGPLGFLPTKPVALQQLARCLSSGQVQASVVSDIRAEMWHKAAMNCAVNALTAILDCTNGTLLPLLGSPLILGVLREVTQVMAAENVALPADGMAQLRADLRSLVQATAGNSSSMREDLRAGRETEVARLNLAVVEAGLKHGINCPLNASLGRMVSSFANRGAR